MLQSRYTTSYLRRTHENRPKLGENWKLPPTPLPDRILHQKGKGVFKMTKFHNFKWIFAISGSFDEKTIKNRPKSDLNLAEHSWTKGRSREYNKTIENLFSLKLSHIIRLKATKFQLPLFITLGEADENRSPVSPWTIGSMAMTHKMYDRWKVQTKNVKLLELNWPKEEKVTGSSAFS